MADNYFGITDVGKVRDNNEDTFIAQEIFNDKAILACVIDGVGGYAGGEIAAEIASESINEYFKNPPGELIPMMKESITIANEKIFAEKQLSKSHQNMACVLTLAVIDIKRNQFHYAHVGDTRLYLLRDNSLVKVSKDHSFVGFLEDSGRLTEDAAMKHPKRNEINKALGFGNNLKTQEDYIETGESPFLPGDMLLFCSDGLTDMVNIKDITSILVENTSLNEKANQLISAANNNGGKDNITVVLVQNSNISQKQEATMPLNTIKREKVVSIQNVTETTQAVNNTDKKKDNPALDQIRPSNNNINIITVLSILSLILLVSTLTLWWKRSNEDSTAADNKFVQNTNSNKIKNPQEAKLQNAIDSLVGDTLMLSVAAFPNPIIISDTLLINRDSLYIKTTGNITFSADSNYKGPAIVLSSLCKHIVLDSLKLENFRIGIEAQNDALELRNVRFKNCLIPVNAMITFAGEKYVNGRINLNYFKLDSLPQFSIK